MKKIIISILCITFICGYIFYRYHSKHSFRCEAQLISHIEQSNSNIEANLHADIILMVHNEGSISITGSVKQDDKKYLVSRTIFFTIQPSELSGVNKTIITHEQINKSNEIPEEIWLKYISPESSGVKFYSEISKVNKNGMLVELLSNPLFVCARVEK